MIKRFNELSINIKRSQANPQKRNFIYEIVRLKQQLVEHFVKSFYRLYYTSTWTKSYKISRASTNTSSKSTYHPNMVVNLSSNPSEFNSVSSSSRMGSQFRSINPLSSQMISSHFEHTPMRSNSRAMNWNNNSNMHSPGQAPISPYRQLNFNPMNQQFHTSNSQMVAQNQRYAVPRSTGISISENRPSDSDAMNLVNQVLDSTSPVNPRSLIARAEQDFQMSPHKIMSNHFHPPNPVVPEFQHPQRQAVRETIEIPVQPMMSVNTFTPVSVEDMPAQSKQQLELSRISGSPEKLQNDFNATISSSIEVPKYNFEDILKKALEDQGEEYTPNEENDKEEEVKKSKSNKKFLKRKKRYDPREAIRKEKRQKAKNRTKKNSKSAFPEGFFKQKDQNDSDKSDNEQKSEVDEPPKTRRNKSPKVRKVSKLQNDEKSDNEIADNRSQNHNDETTSQDNKTANEDDEAQEIKKYEGKPKPFLKRKTRGVKFQKLNWKNVKSRTDCWGKKSARHDNRDHSEKSIPAVVKYQKSKKVAQTEQVPKTKKSKNLKNIQSRIDTGIRKDVPNYMYEEQNDSFDYTQYNLGEYANEGFNQMQSIQQRPDNNTARFQFSQNMQDMMNQNDMPNNIDADYGAFSDHEPFEDHYMHDYDKPEMATHHTNLIKQQPMVPMQDHNRYTNEIEEELGKFLNDKFNEPNIKLYRS